MRGRTEILIRVRVPFGNAVLLSALVLLGAAPGEINSDTQGASVTSYFLEPSQQVSFAKLVTTGDTHLGRETLGAPLSVVTGLNRPVKVGSGADRSERMSVYGNVRVGGKLCFDGNCFKNFDAGIGCFGDNTPPCTAVPTRVPCGSGSLALPFTLKNAVDMRNTVQGTPPERFGLTAITSVLLTVRRQGQSQDDWECKLPPARPTNSQTCQGGWYLDTGNPTWRSLPEPQRSNAWKSSHNWECNPENPGSKPNLAAPSEYCRDLNSNDAFTQPGPIGCNMTPDDQNQDRRTCTVSIPSCANFATQDFRWTLDVSNTRE